MDNQKKRASAEQLEALLVELERRPALLQVRAGGGGAHLPAPHAHRHLWRELADRLNALGVRKTPAKWQQAWRDWKSNTKKKAAKVLEERAKVGEGKVTQPPLTELEVRVLDLLGPALDPADPTDLTDLRLPEIDISSIAELDPLSSEGEGEGPTVKRERASPPPRAGRRPAQHSHKHHSRKAKRHRIELRQKSCNSELSRKETSGLLQRLIYLEESRQSSEQKTSTVLERIARALEDNTAALKQQAAAADNQACALERLTAAVQSRYVYHSGA